ncbi:hypothetical protein L596_003409 [Steinernema carpocapsae]|uniref:Uncharacterized protein n=1 Tax=Steinernema carpocapsae TaxID=34508 RepID=A0A4U8UU20_STECR|nr:hypothetical protein L596_003409 [Steinernema carpocapsae]
MGVASSSDSNVPSLIAATKIMNIHGDWTPPSSVADDSAKSEDQVSSSGTNNEKESSVKESASPTPPPTQLDDGPQEFVPGKKWEWRDPNKVAEDPNATPGNCKPNPLMAAGNNMNFAFSNSAVNTANPYGPEVPSGNASTFWPNNSQGFNVPYGRDMYNSVRARLPSNGQFMPQRGMSGGYSNSNHNRMQTPPGKGVFIVLNHQGANETQLNFSCTRAGQLLNVASLGGQTVLLRYADSSSEGVLQKLKADFPGNERIKTVSEEEVEKLLKNRSPTMSGSAWAAVVERRLAISNR